jgi:hypothetical protein
MPFTEYKFVAQNLMSSIDWSRVRQVNQARPQKIDWLVDEYIPTKTVTLISAVSGAGKSVVSLYLALCILSGKPWFGLQCAKGPIAYWDQDNPDSILTDNRLWALAKGMEIDLASLPCAPIFRSSSRIFGNDRERTDLLIRLKDMGAIALFVDTFAAVNPGGEGDAIDVTRIVVDNLFPFADAGITPILMHHIGKDLQDGRGGMQKRTGIHAPRGSTALVASVGAAFNLMPDKDGHVIECVKPRYGKVPKIEIEYDEDGCLGDSDFVIRISNRGIKVSQEFLTQFVRDHNLTGYSSRKLVEYLRVKGFVTSQSTAARVLRESNE